jgi:hypothetical protein
VREKNKLWFETHDTIQTELETRRRIVTPDLTSRARFAVTERDISHNTCYSIYYDGDLCALAAVLNSSTFEFVLKSTLPEMDSGFWRQMKRDLVDLPVLLPDELGAEVTSELANHHENKRWEAIDSIVYNELDLTDKQINLIESFIQ